MATLTEQLRAGAVGDLLPWAVEQAAMAASGLGCAAVEAEALALGLLPARYARNRRTLSIADQHALLGRTVAVVGCGGLGGYAIEELARLGVGRLLVVDPDRFEEHNLNRQLLSTVADLGAPKVEAAVRRVAAINPAVAVVPHQVALTAGNGAGLLAGADLAIDALDSVPARLALAEVCRTLGRPLVHGAIAGWYGHVATQLPGERIIERLYASASEARGVEQELGNPAFTPAVVASLQVAEVCKILLGVGTLLRNRQLTIDLLTMDIEVIPFQQSGGDDR